MSMSIPPFTALRLFLKPGERATTATHQTLEFVFHFMIDDAAEYVVEPASSAVEVHMRTPNLC